MDQATLLQLAGSALAICVLALAAAWARIPRPVGPLDEATARALIAEELPDIAVERLWLDAEGRTAVARAGDEGVVLFRVGDGFAVRQAPWARVAGAAVRKGRALIRFGDPAAPVAAFQLGGLEKAPFA